MEHPVRKKAQHSPHRWVPKTYGQKFNLAPSEDTSEILSSKATRHIHRIFESFLYYVQTIDNKIYTSVND